MHQNRQHADEDLTRKMVYIIAQTNMPAHWDKRYNTCDQCVMSRCEAAICFLKTFMSPNFFWNYSRRAASVEYRVIIVPHPLSPQCQMPKIRIKHELWRVGITMYVQVPWDHPWEKKICTKQQQSLPRHDTDDITPTITIWVLQYSHTKHTLRSRSCSWFEWCFQPTDNLISWNLSILWRLFSIHRLINNQEYRIMFAIIVVPWL